MSANNPAPITLADVDDLVLEELVKVATTDASANDVTPPLTAAAEWTQERIAWLGNYHRDCRPGLDGPKAEATWAVVVAGEVAGSVRLKRTDDAGVLETGIWLARRARGQGLGSAAVAAVAQLAGSLGFAAVCADTTPTNANALAALRSAGFTVGPTDRSGVVHACLEVLPSGAGAVVVSGSARGKACLLLRRDRPAAGP